ncbi:MAG: hypothetical protein ABJA81_13330 [Nocardioidaceae bacterium]
MGSRVNGPAIVGAVALIVAGWLLWLTLQKDDDKLVTLDTARVVNKAGGYSILVPEGLTARKSGKVTRIRDKARTVVITITPTTGGAPATTNTRVLAQVGSTYRTVDLLRSQKQKVDGRPAVASYGRATTTKGVKLRFVLITVKGSGRNFALSTFAAADSDPGTVLPRVRAVANGFHVLRAR